jgi:hypothetical protein
MNAQSIGLSLNPERERGAGGAPSCPRAIGPSLTLGVQRGHDASRVPTKDDHHMSELPNTAHVETMITIGFFGAG